MKAKKILAFCLAAIMLVSASVTASAAQMSSYSYQMSASEKTSGPHKYMNNANMTYRLRYDCTLSGLRSSNDAATVKCYKDEWTYATRKPDDQTFRTNGNYKPWWGSCEQGDYNLELHAAASGRTLSTSGKFENW